MQNYSDNWRLLTTLTAEVAATHQSAVARDYSEHAHAQMLGCFLAHAKLTTPNLGRDGVKALFAGEQAWPLQDGTCRWVRVDVSVDQLEELGVIAFYGVSDFAALTHSYAELIGSMSYFGFQHCVDSTPSVVPQPNSNLWVTREYRTRGRASITVYHLLLNMRSPATHD
ncbi:hypothetical protein V7V80_01510 [Pseudomonas kermanshahensis]|uniref:Uncharacterized protein n=1 Tax=Pseudomonas kermanshahensis TaxID=2745482 RepID=A0ABU8R0G7_9PSED